jgi:hypothetical protein
MIVEMSPELTASENERGFFVALAALLAVVAASIPVAMVVDERTDRQRPMYSDRATMAWLQFRSMEQGGVAEAMLLRDGETTTVGGQEFAPSPGVQVEVRLQEPGYCVQAENQYGDVTSWACYNGTTNPGRP